jgi:hypothetical protein
MSGRRCTRFSFEHYEQTGGDIDKQEQQCETDKESASVERLGQAGV